VPGSSTLDEEVDNGLDDRRVELLTIRPVIARRDALVEVAVVVHEPKSTRDRRHAIQQGPITPKVLVPNAGWVSTFTVSSLGPRLSSPTKFD
jgi:hypothetical protein